SHNRSKIASADSFALGAKSPAGPTQDGQPASHGHAWINSRVFSTNNLCARNNGSENPIPPGYASNRYKFGSKNSFSPVIQGFLALARGFLASLRTAVSSASGVGGRSPMAVPRSRASHISSSVA